MLVYLLSWYVNSPIAAVRYVDNCARDMKSRWLDWKSQKRSFHDTSNQPLLSLAPHRWVLKLGESFTSLHPFVISSYKILVTSKTFSVWRDFATAGRLTWTNLTSYSTPHNHRKKKRRRAYRISDPKRSNGTFLTIRSIRKLVLAGMDSSDKVLRTTCVR